MLAVELTIMVQSLLQKDSTVPHSGKFSREKTFADP